MQTMNAKAMFSGAEVKMGSVMLEMDGMNRRLTLSEDFQVPGAPAPHWQVTDSMGNTYLLQRLVTAGERYNRSIVLPAYVKDVASVQIWCAFAEVELGRAMLMR